MPFPPPRLPLALPLLASSLLATCAHAPPPPSAPEASAPAPAPGSPPGRDLSTDPERFFGESRCATAGVRFCEGFEGEALDPAVWRTTGTAPKIEPGRAARGGKALHVVRKGNGPAYARTRKPFPAPRNRYYGRAFVYFDALPTAPMRYSHWTIVGGAGEGRGEEIRIGGQLQQGVNRFGVGTDNDGPTGTGDWTNPDREPNPSGYGVPEKRWICLEWLHDGEKHETRVFLDGAPHPSLFTSATEHGGRQSVPYTLPAFTSVWLGWFEYQPTDQRFELWIDEVAIDDERIGCVI
jgi:hypothetical protein